MLAEIIEEPKPVVEEIVKEHGDILFDISYNEEPEDNRSLFLRFVDFITPNMMSSFAGLFETQARYCRIEEEEPNKEQMEEIIYVNKEMTAEYLAEIADKAMMANLKEVVNKAESKQKVESENERVESEIKEKS
ncbi:hypothetical protein Hanom_Chr17g01584751 [Helianthus anomalus]